MRRFFKWTLRGLIALVLLVVVLGGGALVYLNSEGGRTLALDQARDALRAEGLILDYEKSEGGLLSRVVVSGVTLRDSEGVFLRADRLELDWSPTRLISRRLVIDLLRLSGVRFERQPVLPARPTPAETSEGLTSPPVSVRVERLRIDDVTLGPAVAGAPVSLRVEGSAAAGRDLRQVTFELSYRRIDRKAGRGNLRAVVDVPSEKLDLDLKVVEGEGGFVATLMGLPELPGLDVELSGAGTLRGWSGRFKVVSGGSDLTDGSIRLAAVPNLAVALDARLNPSSLVPRLAVLKDPLRVELEATLRDRREAVVDRLRVRTTGLSVAANGRYDLAGATVAAKVAIDAQDLTPLEALMGGNWRGRLNADLTVSGAVATPQVAGKISARSVQTPWGAAAELDTDLTADVGGAAGIRRLVGTLSARALSTPQGRLEEATGRFDLMAPTAGDYPVGRARLDVRDVRALDYRANRLDVTLVSRARPGRTYPALDVSLDGTGVEAPQGKVASLSARGTWTPDGLVINTDGTLRLDLSGLTSRWATAEALKVDVTMSPRAGETYPSVNLRLTGRGLEGQGARIAAIDSRFTGTLAGDGWTPLGRLALDLSGLASPWANADRLKVDATSTARPNAKYPKLVADISGSRLSGQGVSVATLETTYDGTVADDERTPLGRLKLSLSGLASPWANAGELRVDATSAARPNAKYPKVVADISGSKLSGQGVEVATLKTSYDGTVADDGQTPLGNLKLALTGLASQWANAGELKVDATSTARPGAKYPKVVADISGSKLSGQGVEVATLKTSYDGTVADDLRTPLGTLKLALTELVSPWARAGRLSIDATAAARTGAAGIAVDAAVTGADLSAQGSDLATLKTTFDGALGPDFLPAAGRLTLDGTGLASPWAGATGMRLVVDLAGMDPGGLPYGDARIALDGAVAPQGTADRVLVRLIHGVGDRLFADVRAEDATTPQAAVAFLRARVDGILDRATMRPAILSAEVIARAADTPDLSAGAVHLVLASRKAPGAAADSFAFKLDLDAEETVGHSPDAPVQDIGPITLTADGTANLAEMTVSLASFEARAGFARASGRLAGAFRGAPRLSGTVRLSGTPPPALLGGMRIDDPSLELTLDANLAIPDVRVDASGSVARVVTGRPQIDDLLTGKTSFVLRGRYQPGTIALSRFEIENPAVSATGGGTLSEEGSGTLSVRARVPKLSLFEPFIGRDVAGTATVSADLSGSLEKLDGRLRVEGEELVVDGETVGRITLRLDGTNLTGRPSATLRITGSGGPAPVEVSARVENLPDGSWRLDKLDARVFGATAKGAAALAPDFVPREGRIDLNVPNLARIGRLAGLDLSGQLSAQGRIRQRDGQLSGDIKATARNLVVPGARVASLSVDGKVDDAATLKGLRLQASASDVRTSAATISRLRATAQPNGGGTSITLSATGTANGKPVRIETAGTLVERGETQVATISRLSGRYGDLPISLAAPMRVSLAGGNVSVERGVVSVGRGRVTVAGRVAGDSLDARATIQNLPISAARQAGFKVPVQGVLNGTISVSGSSAAPDIDYDLKARNVRPAGAGRIADALSLDARGSLKGERLQLEARLGNLGPEPLTVSARVPLSGGAAEIEARLRGTLDLARLTRFGLLGANVASGTMRVDLRVGGTFEDPRIAGTATMANGRFESQENGTLLADINLRLASTGNALRVEGTASDGSDGRVALNGQIGLRSADSFPLDIRLTSDRARLLRRDGMTATVSSDLRVRGDLTAGLRVAGTVTVNQADVRIPENLPPSVVLIDVVEKNVPPGLRQPKKKPEPASAPLPIVLDVTIDVPRRFFVRGRGVESEWQGRIRIAGSLPDPRVTGGLRTVRGQLDFLGQRFSLANSQIRFDGANLADPILEIDATTTAGEVQGIVQIRGTAQNPTFNLTSDPQLPRDEVLARVLFGSDVGSLTKGQAIRLAAAAAQLASGGGGGITDRLRRMAGLDVLDVGSTGENISDTTVTAGKYIADKVLLKVEQGASEKTSRVGVEIEVFKNVVVESGVGRDGDTRVGVKYRIDY